MGGESGEDGQDRKDGEDKDKNLTTPDGVLTAIPYSTMPFRFDTKQVLLKLFLDALPLHFCS